MVMTKFSTNEKNKNLVLIGEKREKGNIMVMGVSTSSRDNLEPMNYTQ
jgi:hypothetical protein